MISLLVSAIYTAALSGLAFYYITRRYGLRGREKIASALKGHKKAVIFSAFVLAGFMAFDMAFSFRFGTGRLPFLLRRDTLLVGMYLLALTDCREMKIPNIVICVMLGIRLAFLAYEILSALEFAGQAVIFPTLGALTGGLIMLIAMLISRKGVGMGDIKMFFVTGAYVGSSRIIATMFYTFLISAAAGVFLLATKKAKLKDSLPMAPFAFAGVAVESVLLLIGG